MFLKDSATTETNRYDFGFLLVLLLMVIISFLLFYFGIPMVTGYFTHTEAASPASIEGYV